MEGFEEDPAAAFLAREQDDLAGIADDTLGIPATDNTTVSVCWCVSRCLSSCVSRYQFKSLSLRTSLEEEARR